MKMYPNLIQWTMAQPCANCTIEKRCNLYCGTMRLHMTAKPDQETDFAERLNQLSVLIFVVTAISSLLLLLSLFTGLVK